MMQIYKITETDIQDTIESIPSGLASFTVQSPTRFVLHATNQLLDNLLKGDQEKAYGRTILELTFTSTPTLKRIQTLFELVFKEQKNKIIEQPTRLRDGTRIFVRCRATPIIVDGTVKFIICAINDVTELVQIRHSRPSALSKIASERFVICAWCSSVRDDQDHWRTVDQYLNHNAFKRPTHTLCPKCSKKTEQHQRPT